MFEIQKKTKTYNDYDSSPCTLNYEHFAFDGENESRSEFLLSRLKNIVAFCYDEQEIFSQLFKFDTDTLEVEHK